MFFKLIPFLLIVFFLLGFTFPLRFGETSKSRALWIWFEKAELPSEKEQVKVLDFCRKRGIKRVFMALTAYYNKKELEKAREFNRKAHQKGIKVEVLDGNPRWFLEGNHQIPEKIVKNIISFNEGVPLPERFDGIHLDIESYSMGIKDWQDGYLNLLQRLREITKDKISLSLDVPFWFFIEHEVGEKLLKFVDEVTFMSYFDSAEKILEVSKPGIKACVKHKVPFFLGVNTMKINSHFEVTEGTTFYDDGPSLMERELKQVREELKENPYFLGMAIHDYDYYQAMLVKHGSKK